MEGSVAGSSIQMVGAMISVGTIIPPWSYNYWNMGDIPAGTYSVSLSARWVNGQIPAPTCPTVETTLVVAGATPEAVPAPLLGWPALALLGLLVVGLAGWRLRPRPAR